MAEIVGYIALLEGKPLGWSEEMYEGESGESLPALCFSGEITVFESESEIKKAVSETVKNREVWLARRGHHPATDSYCDKASYYTRPVNKFEA